MDILLYKTISRHQGRKLRNLTEDRAGLGKTDPDVTERVSKNVRLAQVRDVADTMPLGKNYEVITLTLRGRSVPEIASVLGISQDAVRSHLRRGIRQIRGALGGHSPEVRAALSAAESP